MRLPDLYHAIWRHRIFVSVTTALLVGAVWIVTSQQQKLYTASTLVRVVQQANDPTDVINSLEAGQRLAQTYARIAETRTVRNQIHQELRGTVGLTSIDISASPVEDLELLTISATHPSPMLARKIANAAPDALRSFVQGSGSPQERVIVVEKARVPSDPSSPNLKLNLALALLLGLVLNGLLAVLVEVLRDPLPDDPGQLEELLGRPVLATVPTLEFIAPKTKRFGRRRRKKDAPRRAQRALDHAEALTGAVAANVRTAREPRREGPSTKSEKPRKSEQAHR